MKMKNLSLIALISLIICGTGVLGFLERHNRPMILRHGYRHQKPEPDSGQSVSIPKSMTLILLTAGVIGVLSVRREKKNKKGLVQHHRPKTISNDRDKAFIKLNKQYLNLQYQITQHRFSGEHPPDCLLKEISDLERQVRLISRALG